ncbi:GTP-binding protein YPT52 [Tritrichomonas foetus]|uniref:GTP-binding protein YPT52 n=1 Tax=Tritrichomonas foetus TaxID=1144522 RepID=A0A1J4KQT0_9EUKA|nr:GTP-binding protein YPT52 [Tritrichomonas foetus]|eukprot:OHT13450.1 GTP-binding protein YPT52 [Tritrichomonas foetus]
MDKVVIIGDAAVGKTSIVSRLSGGNFDEHEQTTISGNGQKCNYKINNDEHSFVIWDTAGQERYRSMTTVYFTGAEAAIIVFDITDEESFSNVDSWASLFRGRVYDEAAIILIGNKIDLEYIDDGKNENMKKKKNKRVITRKEADNMKDKIGAIEYVEVSAKTGDGIEQLRSCIGSEIDYRRKLKGSSDNSTKNINLQDHSTKKKCC